MRDELLYLTIIRESCKPSPYYASPGSVPLTPDEQRKEFVRALYEGNSRFLKHRSARNVATARANIANFNKTRRMANA